MKQAMQHDKLDMAQDRLRHSYRKRQTELLKEDLALSVPVSENEMRPFEG